MLDRLWNRIKHGKIHTAESPDDICVICYENWTNAGTHGLCSLPCGHLFGQSCINKWLQDHDRCPECNAISAQTDIRLIRARNLKVIDNTNEEIFKREIKELKTANHKLTEENARLASQNQLLFVGGNFKSHFYFNQILAIFLLLFVGYLLFFVTSMQMILEPDRETNQQSEIIFEPIKAIGVLVDIIFTLGFYSFFNHRFKRFQLPLLPCQWSRY